jgi:hypothetical protein
MKRIFLLLTIFTLSNELKAQSAENDWQKLALKENPQTLISDNGVKKPKTYIFNEIGFIIQKKNECLCGGQENTIDYIYTPDNKLMEKTTTVGTQITEKIKYTIASNGEVTENYIVGQESMEGEMSTYDPSQITEIKKDIHGNLTQEIIKYPNDNKIQITEKRYLYDKRKNWIQMDTFFKGIDETVLHKKETIKRKIKYF